MLQKFAGPLVGSPFCGAPVRPNMLNMPKSASGHFNDVCNTTRGAVALWYSALVSINEDTLRRARLVLG